MSPRPIGDRQPDRRLAVSCFRRTAIGAFRYWSRTFGYTATVRVARLLLIVPLGLAVLAAGALPPQHVHHRADATPAVIHAHFQSIHQGDEPSRRGDLHERSVSDTDEDPDGTTVAVGQTVGPRQTVRSDYAPSLLPEPAPVPGLIKRYATVRPACLELAFPPPLRQSTPRAPPV
jgi:hypothetical protein